MNKNKIKKIIILIAGCGFIGGGVYLYLNRSSNIIDDSMVGKNVVKNTKETESNSNNKIVNTQSTVRDANGIKVILRTKYSASFNENATVTWNDKLSLYEVVNGLQIIYVTPNGKNVISGHVYDMQTGLDYTDSKLAEISKIDVKTLPLNKFIKLVNGDGSRVVYVFAYLDDQFKQYYNSTLANTNNTSFYILLNQATKADSDDEYIRIYKEKLYKGIACSDDSERELRNYLKPAKWNPITNIVDNCNQKIKDDNIGSVFSSYKIVWSPTLFLANGYRYKALPDYQLNQLLEMKESTTVSSQSSKKDSSSINISDKKTSSQPSISKQMGGGI